MRLSTNYVNWMVGFISHVLTLTPDSQCGAKKKEIYWKFLEFPWVCHRTGGVFQRAHWRFATYSSSSKCLHISKRALLNKILRKRWKSPSLHPHIWTYGSILYVSAIHSDAVVEAHICVCVCVFHKWISVAACCVQGSFVTYAKMKRVLGALLHCLLKGLFAHVWANMREWEQETRYVLSAMLHDQSRGSEWEVRDVWGLRGQGCPVTLTPGWEWGTVVESLIIWK